MTADRRIYFDHAATTPLDGRVLAAMLPVLEGAWGNPSSIYAEGREARRVLDAARRDVAAVLNARPNDIVFTSGGSESDNLAIRGAALASVRRGKHIVTSAIEHHAVLHTVEQLEHEGFEATYLPVDREGFVAVDDVMRALRPDTTVVSIMYANNEVGTVEPISELVRAVKAYARHIVFHTDAVQAAGALALDVEALGVDMLSLAAHKFYGPKGVGVLYIRPRTPFVGQLVGGSQERNRRAGTENVAGAVGLAKALQLAEAERVQESARLAEMRDRLMVELPRRVPELRITGPRIGGEAIPPAEAGGMVGAEALGEQDPGLNPGATDAGESRSGGAEAGGIGAQGGSPLPPAEAGGLGEAEARREQDPGLNPGATDAGDAAGTPLRDESRSFGEGKAAVLRLPNSFSCCLEGVEGESVLIQLDLNGISASSGSACTTGSLEPSHVLTAMGVPAEVARSSLRITLGHANTMADIEVLLEKLPVAVQKLRALAPQATV